MDWMTTQIIQKIGLLLGVALVGALVSYVVRVSIDNWRVRRKTELWGEWRSRYISQYYQHEWVEEDIEITSSIKGICFKSHANPKDPYVAYAELVQDHTLMGRWESTRSAAKGALMLTINPLEDIMYGYYVARGTGGKCFYGPWVLAKKDNETDQKQQLVEGFRLLEESSDYIDPQKYLKSQSLGITPSV